MLIVQKKIMDSMVDSYSLWKYESGILHLIINTRNKWLMYGNLNIDTEDGSYIDLDDDQIESVDYTLKIPELILPLVNRTVKTSVQEKDQINFYFIPYNLVTDNKKIIEQCQKEK